MGGEHRDIIEEIKGRLPIESLVGEFVELKRAGKDYMGICPFHADSDPSFSVAPAKGMYHCFGCGKSGDVFDFWMAFHQAGFRSALGELASRAGVVLPKGALRSTKSAHRYRYPKERREKEWQPETRRPADEPADPDLWADKARRFNHWAYERLYENAGAMAQLQARGIREASFWRYGLGWNPGEKGGDYFRAREGWGLRPKKKENGRDRALWLPVGFVIPYYAEDRIVRLRIRRPEPRRFGPKYYIVPGSGADTMILPPFPVARPEIHHVYVVVEAELDAVLIHQEAGDLVGAMALGSSNTRPDVRAAGLLKKAARILNALDYDRAGREAQDWWRTQFPGAKRWPVPVGKDPGEAFQMGVNIQEWVQAAL